MRVPLYSKNAVIGISQPFLRKKLRYLEVEVCEGRAQWVDDDDHSKGVICRETIHFGPAPVHIEEVAQSPGMGFIIFREPKSARIGRMTSAALMVRRLEFQALDLAPIG